MADKIDNEALPEVLLGTATTAVGLGVSREYIRENKALKSLEAVPNNKRIDAFQAKLKPGDIILEGHGKGYVGTSVFEEEMIDAVKKNKTLKRLRIDKLMRGMEESQAIRIASGGTRLHHGGIYLGNGRVAHISGDVAEVDNLRDIYKNKKMLSIRFSKDTKVGKGIAQAARSFAKEKTPYREFGDLVKQAFKRNFIPLKTGYDGTLTCTELTSRSVNMGGNTRIKSYISQSLIDSNDILIAGKGRFVAKYSLGKASKVDKLISFVGKTFRGTKYAVAGASIGLGAYYAYKLYKSKFAKGISDSSVGEKISTLLSGKAASDAYKSGAKGRWITTRGRKVFIPR